MPQSLLKCYFNCERNEHTKFGKIVDLKKYLYLSETKDSNDCDTIMIMASRPGDIFIDFFFFLSSLFVINQITSTSTGLRLEKNLLCNVLAPGWVWGGGGATLGPNYELNDRVVTVKNDPLEWRQ